MIFKRLFSACLIIVSLHALALEDTTGTIVLDFYPLFSVASGDKLYVWDGVTNTVAVIDTTKNVFVKNILVGQAPSAGLLKGTYLYITNTQSGTVSIIDTATDTVKKTLTVERGPKYMILSGSNLFVSNTLGDSVSIIDTTTQAYLRTIPVGSGPTVMSFLSGRLYTANSTSTSVSFINTSKPLWTISTGLHPASMTPLSGRYLYVANSKSKSVTIIDTGDTNATQVSEPKVQITVWNGPSASILVGTKIYVSNTDDGTISVINTANNTVSTTISVWDKPTALAVIGKNLYVANSGVDTVSMIDTATDTVKQTIKVGTSPTSLTVSGTKIYVQNKDTKSISIIYTAAPALKSFSSDTPNATYGEGSTINIAALFDQKLAPESTMKILLNNGVELILNTVDDQVLSTNYTIRPGDDIGDLSVRSIKSASIIGVSGLKTTTSYTIPTKKNIGDLKNIIIATSYPTLNCSATGSKLYRKCNNGVYTTGIKSIIDNLICEGFIAKQTEKINYRPMKPLSRLEALDIAVKMLRVVPPDEVDYQYPFQDIPKDNKSPLTTIVETGLVNNLVSTKNTRFEPQRRISRAEAYTMVLKSVCFPLGEGSDWKSVLYDPMVAKGMTTVPWEKFKPDQALLRKEFFTLISRTSDWANKTGWCMPQICAQN